MSEAKQTAEVPAVRGIYDSHAHYDDSRFDGDRETLFLAMQKKGVSRILNAGCDVASTKAGLEYARRFPNLFVPAAGLQPENIPKENWQKELDEVLALTERSQVVAVGEIGLDYHWDDSRKDLQKEILAVQLEQAGRLGKPVIIHCRDAVGDCMELLRKYRPKGVMHCFSGSVETAKEVLSLGMYLGFTGVLTFPNAKKARAVVDYAPVDRLLLETDAPYMAPVPYRGQRCDSSMIAATVAEMARIKGVSAQEMTDRCAENARKLFGR